MEEDNRPDENPEEEESDAGWYFDLPQGAWERQEAKNRELRQSVRRNVDAEPPKDVFGAAKRDDADEPDADKPPWGAGQDAAKPSRPTTWTFGRDESDEPARPQLQVVAGDEREAPDYSTEPDLTAPKPFALRSRRVQEDDEPRLNPPPGLFGHEEPGEQPSEGDERPALRPFSARSVHQDEPEARTPFVRGDRGEPVEPEHASPRWGELFSEKASDGASMLEGMRNWAHQDDTASHEPTPGDRHRPVPPAPDADLPGITPIPIRVQRHAEDEPPLVNSDNPQTRWDQMFARKASEDSGMLDGMRAWATTAQDEDDSGPPRIRLEAEREAVDDSHFKPFEWEDDTAAASEFPGLAARHEEPEEEKKGFIGKLFGRKKKSDQPAERPAFDRDAWASAEDAPDGFPGTMSMRPREEPLHPGWLGRSDATEDHSPEPDDGPALGPADPHSAAGRASGWSLEDEDDDQGPVRLPQDDLRTRPTDKAPAGDRPASWLDPEPSEDDKSRFSELSSWFTNRNAAPADDDVKAVASETEAEPSPVAAADVWEPAAWETPTGTEESTAPTASAERADADDKIGWHPEPLSGVSEDDDLVVATAVTAEPSAIVEPEEFADEIEFAQATDSEAMTQPALDDDDPWAPVRAIDEESDAIAPAASEPAEASDEAVGAVVVLDEPASASAPGAQEPATDDPWAAYLRGRVEEAKGDESEPGSAAVGEPPATAAADGDSLWDSAFARVHGEALAEEEPSAEEAPDDPWAAISKATGYDEHAGGVPGFRASAEVESALQLYEAEREAEEAYHATAEEAFPSALDGDASRAVVELPAWDDTNLEDDTVLRAFQAHASSYDDDDHETAASMPSSNDTDTLVFDELLGEDAEEIVADASQPTADNRYFGRMQGWAPQRTPGERQPFPWEKDAQEPARTPDAREEAESSLEGWSRVEEARRPGNPSPVTDGSGHHEAPSVRRRSRSKVLVREIVETGLLALLVFLSVRASFQNFKVDGYSMWPTLDDGEYLIVNKLAYSEVDMDRLSKFVPFVEPGDDPTREVFGGPARGDIVVLKDPGDTRTDLIKRIIGMPGETLEIVDGKVYVNDQLLVEPYIKEEWHDDKQKIAIPDGYYFVMGDNRNNSKDSRSTQIGLISKELLIGKAMLTYWPREKFGLAPNGAGNISEKDGRPVVTTERVPE